MRIVSRWQLPRSTLLAIFWLFPVTVVLACAALSVAQESPGQVDYFNRPILATNDVAKLAAVGQDSIEVRQLQYDQLNAKQPLSNIQGLERKQLIYTLLVVEIPTEAAKPIIQKWKLLGGSTSVTQDLDSGNAPQTTSTRTSEFRISDGLSEEQINQLVGLGKVISMPKIIGEDGVETNVHVGHDLQFVAAFEPVEDGNGTTVRPVIATIPDGIKLDLTGTLDHKKENVQLQITFKATQINEMGPLTCELLGRQLTVLQPVFASSGTQTCRDTPINETIALCSEQSVQESVVERGVPLIGRIPYFGKLFKNTAKATTSTSKLIFIRCELN